MFRNLSKLGLAVCQRQNEMIELALTNKFRSIEIDMRDMLGRAEAFGAEFACQFVQSCDVEVGVFELPIDFSAPDEAFVKSMGQLDAVLELASSLNAKRCYAKLANSHPDLPFHENFEKQRLRITGAAEKLSQHGLQLGLALNGLPEAADQQKFITTAEELLTFVKAIGRPDVGLVLDTFHWSIADEAATRLDQIEIDQVVSVVLSDVCPEASKGDLTANARILPGTSDESTAKRVYQWLQSKNYQGPVAVGVAESNTVEGTPQRIVDSLKIVLDKLDGVYVEPEPVAEEEPAEEEVGTTSK